MLKTKKPQELNQQLKLKTGTKSIVSGTKLLTLQVGVCCLREKGLRNKASEWLSAKSIGRKLVGPKPKTSKFFKNEFANK